MRTRFLIVALGCFASLTMTALPFGQSGHKLVGGIADHIIDDQHPEVRQRLKSLLGDLTLAQAALIPDMIKGWDKNRNANVFTLFTVKQELQNQLFSYWEANSEPWDGKEGELRHHVFHYTDVPVEEDRYNAGSRGRSPWDVVHMIPYCIRVVRGDEPEDNNFKITKAVAVILLAHFLGDIHQPLHVGSQYFLLDKHSEEGGSPANGDTVKHTVGDAGGNTLHLNLRLDVPGQPNPQPLLHGFWDNLAVTTAFNVWKQTIPGDFATALAGKDPGDWKPIAGSNPETWAEKWADEILPAAREAHTRLSFTGLTGGVSHGEAVADGFAAPAGADPVKASQEYTAWAGKTVGQGMHKGGWRLAELLTQILH